VTCHSPILSGTALGKLSGRENIVVKELGTIHGNTGPRVFDDFVSHPAFRSDHFACRLAELGLRNESVIEENVEQIRRSHNVNVMSLVVN